MVLPSFMPSWGVYVIFAAMVFVSLVAGFFVALWSNLGFFIVGGWLGATGGLMVFNTFLIKLTGSHSKEAMYVFVFICVLVAGYIATKVFT